MYWKLYCEVYSNNKTYIIPIILYFVMSFSMDFYCFFETNIVIHHAFFAQLCTINPSHVIYNTFCTWAFPLCISSSIFSEWLSAFPCHIWYILQCALHLHFSSLNFCDWFWLAGSGFLLSWYDWKRKYIIEFGMSMRFPQEF